MVKTNQRRDDQRHSRANQLRGEKRSDIKGAYAGERVGKCTRSCNSRIGKRCGRGKPVRTGNKDPDRGAGLRRRMARESNNRQHQSRGGDDLADELARTTTRVCTGLQNRQVKYQMRQPDTGNPTDHLNDQIGRQGSRA